VLGAHRDVHESEPFTRELFDRWYLLFAASVDESWHGPIAERAKVHAARMAKGLAHHLLDLDWQVPEEVALVGGTPPGPAQILRHGGLRVGPGPLPIDGRRPIRRRRPS